MRAIMRLAGTTLMLAVASTGAGPHAQQEPDIRGKIARGGQAYSLAVPTPRNPASQATADEIAQTIRDDLDFNGWFDIVDPSLYRLVPEPGAEGEPYEAWESIGVEDAFVRLEIVVVDGKIDLTARLYDVKSQSLLGHWRYGGSEDLLRRVAHTVSDEIIRKYTGKPGVAMTRIAFVSPHDDGKEVYLMDYDGARVRRLTTTHTINLSPVWSPNGNELAYVSWRGKQPGVYVMSAEGEIGHLPTVGGELATSPDWSPDGRRLAYTSDVEGNMEIYLLDRGAGRNTRLTRDAGIDTAPAISPNGREIAFTSDRTGQPQIYLMGIDGLNVRRVSWSGTYNDAPAWSPDGAKLAYSSRIDGRFEILLMDLESNATRRLTSGMGNNENPRWSPDGRHLVFASNRSGGSYAIYTMRNDGSDARQLTRGLNAVTPDWSR